MGAVRAESQEDDVLRRVFPWAALVALTTGGATVLLNDLAFS